MLAWVPMLQSSSNRHRTQVPASRRPAGAAGAAAGGCGPVPDAAGAAGGRAGRRACPRRGCGSDREAADAALEAASARAGARSGRGGRRSGRRALALAVSLAAATAAPGSADAASQRGIAVVTEPDGRTFTCFHDNAIGGFDCARAQCEAAGAAPCMRTRWCFPAGWSGLMRLEIDRLSVDLALLCGAPSAEALDAMLAALCEADGRAKSCVLMLVWDPEGREFHIEAGETMPDVPRAGGEAAPAAGADAALPDPAEPQD